MAFFVCLGEVSDALDIIENCRLNRIDVHGRGRVRLSRRLVRASESSSDGRHVVGLFVCLCEEIGV